jgi:hypothetical protein
MTLTNLQDGVAYTITCQARNSAGFSSTSQSIQLNVGVVPVKPYNVLTANSANLQDVAITWDTYNQQCPGWPVTGCTVAIQINQYQAGSGFSNNRVVSYQDITGQCYEAKNQMSTNQIQYDNNGNVINW